MWFVALGSPGGILIYDNMVREDGKHVGWIYCYTCVDESLWCYGWDYVGQTRNQKGLKERDKMHLCKAHGKFLFDRAYQAHPNAFTLDVVDEFVCDTEQELIDILNDREQYYIRLFASYNDWGMGFNLTTGGGECVLCDETRKKISESTKSALANPETRKKISESTKSALANPETRKKISESTKSALANPETRKKISEAVKKQWEDPEMRKKMSDAGKKRYEDPEARRKQSELLKGKNTKPCQLLDLETGFVYEFESRLNAAEFLGIKHATHIVRYKNKPYNERWIYIPNDDSVRVSKLKGRKKRKVYFKPCQLLDLETGFVRCFESVTKCAEFLQISICNLYRYKTKPYKKRWIYIQGEC